MGRKLWVVISIVIILQFFSRHLFGLDPQRRVDEYLVDRWDMSMGIPSNTIVPIIQTPDGYLWIGTSKGLVRFDGMIFSNIHFLEKEKNSPLKIRSLFVDREGNLWIGSSLGLTLYQCKKGRFKTFTGTEAITEGSATPTNKPQQTGLSPLENFRKKTRFSNISSTEEGIRHITGDSSGNLWVSFDSSYVNRFSAGKFTEFGASQGLQGTKINAIIEDQQGNLLFVTREKGIFRYKDEKFSKYLINGLNNLQINTMYKDSKGDLWLGTDTGLFRVSGKEAVNYTSGDGLSSDFVMSITEDNDRNLWVGTTKGLNRLQVKENGTLVFESLLESCKILSVFEDREKSLWIGTYDSGLLRLKDAKFISYKPLEEYQGEVFLSMFQDRHGDTWIGTFSGKLFRCRGNRIIEMIQSARLSGKGISAIAEDADGNLWLGTNGRGIFRKKNGSFVHYTTQHGLADNQVTSIYRDSRGNLWIGTFGGVSVYCYPDGGLKSFKSSDGLLGNRVHNVYEDRNGSILIAADKGITLLTKVFGGPESTRRVHPIRVQITGHRKNLRLYPLIEVLRGSRGQFFKRAPWSPKAILPGISVTCIYEDPAVPEGEGPVYWIATDGEGLKRLSLKDGSIITYNTAKGMTTDSIYQFFEDRQGYFWFMSKNGILRVAKSELNRLASGDTDEVNCISFGTADGMLSSEFNNEFSRHSALQTRSGELWFITRKWISIVNPGKIRLNKKLPPVVIETVSFDRKSVPIHQFSEVYTVKGAKNFSAFFNALTFLSPGKVKFKYRLEGFDRDWILLPPGKERIARYQDLDWGSYTFKVIACNAEGVWNYTGTAIDFTLKPFLYQTLFFKIAILIFAAFLAAAFIYIYKKRVVKKKHREDEEPEKYKGFQLEPDFVRECIRKLKHLVEVEKIYRDEKISLQSLAKRISVKPYILSQVLNEKLSRSFYDYINYYRIEEAKEILKSPRGENLKIDLLAEEVGFNTKAAFYKVFKRHTGKTPARYKKEAGQVI